jgi:hypothetical protein
MLLSKNENPSNKLKSVIFEFGGNEERLKGLND